MNTDFIVPEEYVLVAKIAGPHGLRGDFKVQSFSDSPESMLNYTSLSIIDRQGDLTSAWQVQKSRLQGKTIVIKLKNIDDRDSAAQLQGKGILINKGDLPALADDEYYWYQLVNLVVTTEEGHKLGRIDSIFSNGAQDVMVIKNGKTELLVPITESIVKEHTERGVVIAPPPGLLEVQYGADE